MFLILPFLLPVLLGGLIGYGVGVLISKFIPHLNKETAKTIKLKDVLKEQIETAKRTGNYKNIKADWVEDAKNSALANNEKKKNRAPDPVKVWYNKKGEIVDSVRIEYETIDEDLAKKLKKNDIVIL